MNNSTQKHTPTNNIEKILFNGKKKKNENDRKKWKWKIFNLNSKWERERKIEWTHAKICNVEPSVQLCDWTESILALIIHRFSAGKLIISFQYEKNVSSFDYNSLKTAIKLCVQNTVQCSYIYQLFRQFAKLTFNFSFSSLYYGN